MLNKVLAKMNKEVKAVYREFEFVIPVEKVLEALNNNNEGKLIPGSEAIYRIDSFEHKEEVLIKLSKKNIVIDKASVADNLIDRIQKKGIGMSHRQITLDSIKEYSDSGEVLSETMNNYIGYIKLPENLASRKKVFKSEEAVFRDGKSYAKISLDSKNPATFEILSVKYGNAEEDGNSILSNGLYEFRDNNGMYEFYKKQGRFLQNIESEETILFKSIFDKDNTLLEGWFYHIAFGASPSNERQKVIYMIDVSNGNERAHNALNILTYGAYDLTIIDKKMSYDELAKVTSRWFQWMAPSVSMGPIKAYAIYCGKFNKDTMDGMSFEKTSAMSKAIENVHNILIDPIALQGMFKQGRDGQLKAGVMPIEDELLEMAIYHLDNNPIFFLKEEITPEIQKKIAEGMKGKGEYARRVICIGSKEIKDVQTLYDTNGMKSSFDFTREIDFTLLRILRSNDSNFSRSIFEKMLAKDKERAIRLVSQLLVDNVMTRLDRAYINPEASIIKPDTFDKENWYMDEVIQSIFPSYLKMDKDFSTRVIENTIKSTNKSLEKFKIPMGGKNSGITVGIEVLFNIPSLIGDHEVFCPAAERMLRKENRDEKDWNLFMIKYPSMDINEYSINRVISKKELKSRIKEAQIKLGFSKKLLNKIIDYYMTLHDSVMVVPACELFKYKHAGSDFDTDQVSWSINQELVSILKQDEDNNIAVVIR